MSGSKGTVASRELLRAGVPQIPTALERQILAGIQEPSRDAQVAAEIEIEKAKRALRALHLAQKLAETSTGRAGYGGRPGSQTSGEGSAQLITAGRSCRARGRRSRHGGR